MPLSLQHRHAVLLAEPTRDISTITTVVTEVLAANPETSLLDIETALRHADRQSLANITEALTATPKKKLARYRNRAPRRRRPNVFGGQQHHSRFPDCVRYAELARRAR